MESTIVLLSAALIAAVALLVWRTAWSRTRGRQFAVEKQTKDPYSDIEPLVGFNWETTAPVKIRPFKSKYHLTMALESLPLSNLIEIDNTLRDRLLLRRKIMDEHLSATVQCNPIAKSAVMEFYSWMTGTYLPTRFPTIYKVKDSHHLYDSATQALIPLVPPSASSALETLGSLVDTDFLILLPRYSDNKSKTGEEKTESGKEDKNAPIYHLEAFVTCFPSGFNTRSKLSLPLAGIHKPVPGYATKLERSMDRFFARVENGKAYKRVNWTVTTNDKLFSQGGTHMYAEDSGSAQPNSTTLKGSENAKTLDVAAGDLDEQIERQKGEVVIEECRLRCERQTLHRLPETGALVFAFKTYQYTLDEVKEEGLGDELVEAIDGLGRGSVPEMAFYKRGVIWGESVKEYLRS